MQIIACNFQDHAHAILEIFNEAILHSTALYDYKPRSIDSMAMWFEEKETARYPVIGAIDDDGKLTGFASYGSFRARPAYKYTIEHSLYVHKGHRRQGIGAILLTEIIKSAQAQQYHVIVGGIDMANSASIALHEKFDFVHSGTVQQAGFKFGRWLDLGFYQLILDTPVNPGDG